LIRVLQSPFQNEKRKIAKISEITTISASTGSSGKIVIKALTYPQRPFLISPKFSAVSISTKKLNLTINGESYSTCAILVKPNYYYSNKPYLIFEHTAVFEEYPNYNTATIVSESSSFSKNRITIYLINCSFSSFSTTQSVNLFLEPVSYGGQRYYSSLNVTFESYDEKTANKWRESLNKSGFDVGGSGRDVTINATKKSDDDGEVWYYFNAGSEGSCTISFSISSSSVDYDVVVSAAPSGGGIFDVSWNVSSFDWNVSLVGSQRTFKVSVHYNNDPVKGAVVDLSTDAPDLVSYPESVTTDQNGESTVTVTALDNGTAHLFATAGGSGGILKLIISGAGGGFCPTGWGYWREITIHNNVDEDLTDYQIKIEMDTQSLISAGKMKGDCGDIRFYDENWGSTLSYWIEEGTCDSSNTVIWVKVPNIPASGTVKINMIYGNPSATSESDIDSTFYDGTLYYTRYSTSNPESLDEGINAFKSASDQPGYCKKFITNYENIANSNSNGCGGSNQNIAFWVEAYFYVDNSGLWRFRYGPDFGRGVGCMSMVIL